MCKKNGSSTEIHPRLRGIHDRLASGFMPSSEYPKIRKQIIQLKIDMKIND